ncbi:MAG: hypothetical protein JW712_05165 [Dehalococcoidales bacterium]|nr:hypothetical protein [Dehalococcoidales bacterium]
MPFQLGHPLGTPNDADFQKRVLMALFDLFDRPAGPVLEDYGEDEEEVDDMTVLSCPVIYTDVDNDSGDQDPLLAGLNREMMAMRSWYDMAVAQRQRTTVGVSGIELDNLAGFVYSFLGDETPENPRSDVPLSNSLKMAVEDLKSYYIEGITAQPGQEKASSRRLADWFWDETVAGKVIWDVKTKYEKSEDRMMAMTAGHMLVPGDIVRKRQTG